MLFLDSNLPMYVAGAAHPNREPSRKLLAQVRQGLAACSSTEVLQEILHRYSSLGRLDLAREVYDAFVELCPVIFTVTLADTDLARDLVCDGGGRISTRDAVHAAVMLNNGVDEIATFDRGFDEVPGIKRRHPR